MSIKNYLSQSIIIASIFLTAIILILAFFIIKTMIKKRRVKQDTQNTKNIKKAKKAISKYKLRRKICELHILEAASEYTQASHLFSGLEVIALPEGIAFTTNTNNLALLVPSSSLQYIEKTRSKLDLKFTDINIHYELTRNSIYAEETLKSLSNFRSKNIIANFYTNNEDNHIDSFNEVIGKENFCKLVADSKYINHLVNFISSKIIRSRSSSSTKYSCISILNRMQLLLNSLHSEAKDLNMEIYSFLILNQKNNFDSEAKVIALGSKSFLSPVNMLINTTSLCFTVIFLLNIISEINLKKQLDLNDYTQRESGINDLQSDLKILESEVDNDIILSSIYPKSIKYRQIYKQYANAIVENRLLPALKKISTTSEATAFLIYLTYLKSHQLNNNTLEIISIVAKLTSISKSDLILVIKYSDDNVISKLIQSAGKEADTIYYRKPSNLKVDSFESFVTYETKYLGISDSKRVQYIYKSLETGLNKCTTQNLLSLLKAGNSVPRGFNRIFTLYQKQTEKTYAICNSTSMETIASDMSMVNNYIPELEITDFKEFLESVSIVVNSLEASGRSLEKNQKSYKAFQKFLPILVKYAVNTITTSTYQNKNLPLIDNFDKDTFIGFRPSFYKNFVYISPLYSQEHMKHSVVPLMELFNQLNNKFKNKYKTDTSFVVSIYKEAIKSYINDYINSYVTIVKQLNAEKLTSGEMANNNSLNFYLISMSSKDSPFNSFINYYKANTQVDVKGFENIKDYFKDNDAYLNSDKYSEYKDIFSKLKNMIAADGYADTYEKIKQGYEPLEKVYANLAEIKSVKDNSLYILLKQHLDVAVKAIESIAINNAIMSLDKSVESEYFYLNNFLPFNFNSEKVLSNKELISYIGDSGSIYLPFKESLKPLLSYNKIDRIWYNPSFSSAKEKILLRQFNKIYTLNSILLNKDGSPKSLDLEITPVPSNDYNYTFSSFLINSKVFVNSLNVAYSEPTSISYRWSAKDPISIILKLDDGETVQKNYSGDWALIKALKDADCSKNICTWELSYKGKSYPVSFKIKSKLIDIIKK